MNTIKLSYYNIYVPINDKTELIYNAMQGAYILSRNSVFKDLIQNKKSIDMLDNGIIKWDTERAQER